MRNRLLQYLCLAVLFLCATRLEAAAGPPLRFGVLPQRSIVMTAEYWNPILSYLEKRTGIPLELKIERTAPEHARQVGLGSYDLVYSNHIFTTANAKAGYRILTRPAGPPIAGEIVVLEDAPISRLEELDGQEVGFPSPAAFVAYAVTMDALQKRNISVKPVFAGNQEGIMAQLKAKRVLAASVNSLVMREYATRTLLRYRVLWRSPDYLNLPIAVHPRIPHLQAKALQDALTDMTQNPEGQKILEHVGHLIGQPPPYGFLRASNRDYQNQWDFYRHYHPKEQHQ